MPLSLPEFLLHMARQPSLCLVVLLTAGVLLVNGWTDAPNAIAAPVASGVLSFRRAATLSAICNLLGVVCITAVNVSVAQTIYSIASFDGSHGRALVALCAAMASVILWAAGAWVLGIPTSESHALVAGISGAAAALEGNLSCIRWDCWGKVAAGLILSTLAGFWAGRWAQGPMAALSPQTARYLQIPGAALTAFLHGAQDGQKFLGIFLLGSALAQGRQDVETFLIPGWLVAFCAIWMALGTLMGGRRIIDTVGGEMVSLSPQRAVSAQAGGCFCLLAATALGLPVSTTHTHTAALLGAGSARGGRWDPRVARSILLAWVLTFPGSFVLSYLFTCLCLALTG